jgi:hypothetical protein
MIFFAKGLQHALVTAHVGDYYFYDLTKNYPMFLVEW